MKKIRETEMETTKALGPIDGRCIFISTNLSRSLPTPYHLRRLVLSPSMGTTIQQHCLCHKKVIELRRLGSLTELDSRKGSSVSKCKVKIDSEE